MKFSLLISLLLFGACYGKKPEKTGKEGKTLPTFQILLSDSTTWLNTNDINPGKPFVLFLFGPNCPYSKVQMQDIIDNMEKFKSLQIFAITPYSFKQMEKFYKNYNLKNYPNITVGRDPHNFFGKYIETSGVPFIAIYDKDKKLVKAFRGKTDINDIKKDIII
jgi:thiol-disulfide isomerase/thioredoxin